MLQTPKILCKKINSATMDFFTYLVSRLRHCEDIPFTLSRVEHINMPITSNSVTSMMYEFVLKIFVAPSNM